MAQSCSAAVWQTSLYAQFSLSRALVIMQLSRDGLGKHHVPCCMPHLSVAPCLCRQATIYADHSLRVLFRVVCHGSPTAVAACKGRWDGALHGIVHGSGPSYRNLTPHARSAYILHRPARHLTSLCLTLPSLQHTLLLTSCSQDSSGHTERPTSPQPQQLHPQQRRQLQWQ